MKYYLQKDGVGFHLTLVWSPEHRALWAIKASDASKSLCLVNSCTDISAWGFPNIKISSNWGILKAHESSISKRFTKVSLSLIMTVFARSQCKSSGSLSMLMEMGRLECKNQPCNKGQWYRWGLLVWSLDQRELLVFLRIWPTWLLDAQEYPEVSKYQACPVAWTQNQVHYSNNSNWLWKCHHSGIRTGINVQYFEP